MSSKCGEVRRGRTTTTGRRDLRQDPFSRQASGNIQARARFRDYVGRNYRSMVKAQIKPALGSFGYAK